MKKSLILIIIVIFSLICGGCMMKNGFFYENAVVSPGTVPLHEFRVVAGKNFVAQRVWDGGFPDGQSMLIVEIPPSLIGKSITLPDERVKFFYVWKYLIVENSRIRAQGNLSLKMITPDLLGCTYDVKLEWTYEDTGHTEKISFSESIQLDRSDIREAGKK
ncbi:MAG: hypothetical protein GY754_24560 [bacterium]|nr:hypothetical protein [bacterium]